MSHLKERAGFPIQKSLSVLNLPARTDHRWRSLSGKKPRPEGIVPKGHWILPEEREKIVAFKRRNPTVGGARLAYRVPDQGIVAVLPSPVFRRNESLPARLPSTPESS